MRKHKYGAKGCVVDGIKFPSIKEGRRYRELKVLQAGGLITELQLQPSFRLIVEGKLICIYRPDFRYLTAESPKPVIEDVKGYRTRDYIIKAKLFQALYPEFRFIET